MEVEWSKGINTLQKIISGCYSINTRRSDTFQKATNIIHDLNRPHIIHNYKLISRDTVKVEMDKLQHSKETNFDDITNFTTEKINK